LCSGDPTLLLDASGHVEALNPAAERLVSRQTAEARGASVDDLLRPSSTIAMRFAGLVDQVICTRVGVSLPDGAALEIAPERRVEIEGRLDPLLDADTGPAGALIGTVLLAPVADKRWRARDFASYPARPPRPGRVCADRWDGLVEGVSVGRDLLAWPCRGGFRRSRPTRLASPRGCPSIETYPIGLAEGACIGRGLSGRPRRGGVHRSGPICDIEIAAPTVSRTHVELGLVQEVELPPMLLRAIELGEVRTLGDDAVEAHERGLRPWACAVDHRRRRVRISKGLDPRLCAHVPDVSERGEARLGSRGARRDESYGRQVG
jgi:PAS fold